MIRIFLIVIGCAGLAACGIDGAPTPPEPKAKPGLSVTGKVEVGIVGGG